MENKMTNDTFEIIAGVLFVVLIAITVASLLPLDIRKKGWKWIWPFLPVVYGIVFLTYNRYATCYPAGKRTHQG